MNKKIKVLLICLLVSLFLPFKAWPNEFTYKTENKNFFQVAIFRENAIKLSAIMLILLIIVLLPTLKKYRILFLTALFTTFICFMAIQTLFEGLPYLFTNTYFKIGFFLVPILAIWTYIEIMREDLKTIKFE